MPVFHLPMLCCCWFFLSFSSSFFSPSFVLKVMYVMLLCVFCQTIGIDIEIRTIENSEQNKQFKPIFKCFYCYKKAHPSAVDIMEKVSCMLENDNTYTHHRMPQLFVIFYYYICHLIYPLPQFRIWCNSCVCVCVFFVLLNLSQNRFLI